MGNARIEPSGLAAPVLILLVLGIAALASISTYAWQHSKVNDLHNQVNSLNAQLTSLNSQVATLSDKLNMACRSTQQTTSTCEDYTYTSTKGVFILVYTPHRGATLASPIAIVGEVPGNWSFEAQFPVQLKDSGGSVMAQTSAHVLGNWQSDQLVPFSAQLTFTTAKSGNGTLVIQKDNPSGLTKNSDLVSIPVHF